jgi:hypothetical protein
MSDRRIVYPLGDGVAILTPCPCGLTIEQIAAKDVPAGLPFLIVDAADIPADRKYRAAWRADFSTPDGYGGQLPEPAPEPDPEPTPQEGTDREYPRLPS